VRSASLRARVAIVVLVLLVQGCLSVKVTERRNRQINFAAYRTYNWLPETGAPTGNPRLDHPEWVPAIIDVADRALAHQGLTRDVLNEPQLWFTYRLSIDRKAQAGLSILEGGKTEAGGGKEFYTGRPLGDRSRRVSEYEVGKFVLEATDAVSNRLIWQATAEFRPRSENVLEKQLSQIRTVADKAAARFPRD